MALDAYDADQHHVGLGTSAGTLYGFVLGGSYRKDLRRDGGAGDFGGDLDLAPVEAGRSRWTQDDWSGGMFQYTWGRDAAMFESCENLLPFQQERTLRISNPMSEELGAGVADNDNPILFVADGGFLFTLYSINGAFKGHKFEIDPSDGSLSISLTYNNTGAGRQYLAADYAREARYVLAATDSTNRKIDCIPVPTWRSGAAAIDGWSWPTAVGTVDPTGMSVQYNHRLHVAFGADLWSTRIPAKANFSSSWTPQWVKHGRLPGTWKASASYNGFLYILTGDRDQRTNLVAWDGSQILPVTEFPYQFRGQCIEVYAGRLYVGGQGSDINEDDAFAELYEITGSSLRLVRSFRNDHYTVADTPSPDTFYDLAVYEGLLWMDGGGAGVMVYDVTTDALYGGPRWSDATTDGIPRKFTEARGALWAWREDPGGTDADIARTAMPLVDTFIPGNPGTITLSEFGPEPAMDKRWSNFHVRFNLQGTYDGDAVIEASVNNGASWVALTEVKSETANTLEYVCDLSALPVSKTIKLRITTPYGDTWQPIDLVATTLSFYTVGDARRVWAITVNGTEFVEGIDADVSIEQDAAAISSQLETWAEDKTALVYRDLNGTDYNVTIQGFTEAQPVIGPKLTGGNAREAFYDLALVEA